LTAAKQVGSLLDLTTPEGRKKMKA